MRQVVRSCARDDGRGADPRNETDCSAGSTEDRNVRAAELQVFAR